MKTNRWIRSFMVLLLSVGLIGSVSIYAAQGKRKARRRRARPTLRLDFENVPVGQLPAGWKSDATHPAGQPNPWQVQINDQAASGKKVLILPSTPHFYGGTFNLCWTDRVKFENGRIEVKVHARTGREDQGGGPIWRVKDANNYYVVRWNPLEDNFRLYYVKDGHRRQIASANVHLDPKKWHTIRVVQRGPRIICWLDGKKLLTARDTHITGPGGVGVWTKSDAASMFDDFVVWVRKPMQKP